MRKNLTTLVRAYMIAGAIYMLLEALIHFLNLRLLDASNWSISALTFSYWMSIFYASLALFVSILLFYLQRDPRKNQKLIQLISLYGLFHGAILIFAALTVRFDKLYGALPSLAFWVPSYNSFLIFEALVLFSFALLIFLWQKTLN